MADSGTLSAIVGAGFEAVALEPCARFSLRCRADERPALESAWGGDLPVRVGEAAESGGGWALCLGPDEWLLQAPAGTSIAERFAQAASSHALTDVSDRSVGVRLSGPRAAEALSCAVPFDVKRMAPFAATRTMFGRVEALVWRPGEARVFEVEVWRSFEAYLWDFLQTIAGELR